MRDLERRTGVNRETIRVLIRKGVVPEPSRPKTNVADYGEEHIRAIQAVRDLQRDTNLTLRQIKEAMNGQPPDAHIAATAFPHLEALVATRVGIDVAPVTIAALTESFPDAAELAKRLKKIGAIEILRSKAGPALSVTDARLVTIWSEMRQHGFTDELGFTPEILTFYLQPADMIAEREATLFTRFTSGKISEDTAATMLLPALRLMLDFFGLLRMKSFLGHIHELTSRDEA